ERISATARTTNTITTRPRVSRARTIFRKGWRGAPSINRSTAASSARSASGWTTGRSSGNSGRARRIEPSALRSVPGSTQQVLDEDQGDAGEQGNGQPIAADRQRRENQHRDRNPREHSESQAAVIDEQTEQLPRGARDPSHVSVPL